jgi:hypothetical protein
MTILTTKGAQNIEKAFRIYQRKRFKIRMQDALIQKR